jgi:hypothetical protein
VETTSGSLGGLVNEQRLSELPLNGRNFNDLVLLQTRIKMLVLKNITYPSGKPNNLNLTFLPPQKSRSGKLQVCGRVTGHSAPIHLVEQRGIRKLTCRPTLD